MELDALGLYDICGLHNIPFWQTTWFYYSVMATGIVVIILSVIVIAYFLRRYFKKRATPWEKALHDLTLLKKQIHTSQSLDALYYDKLSTILKNYLIARFNIDCAGKTDQELGFALETQETALYAKSIQEVLYRSVNVKFARIDATIKQHQDDISSIMTFVQSTIPQQKEK